MVNTITEVVDGSLRAAPPITISAASFLGMGLEDWMYIATILYTLLQGAYLAFRWVQSCRDNKKQRRENVEQDN